MIISERRNKMKEYVFTSRYIAIRQSFLTFALVFCVLSVLCGESETLMGFFVLADEQKGITMMTTLLSKETPGSPKVQDIAIVTHNREQLLSCFTNEAKTILSPLFAPVSNNPDGNY